MPVGISPPPGPSCVFLLLAVRCDASERSVASCSGVPRLGSSPFHGPCLALEMGVSVAALLFWRWYLELSLENALTSGSGGSMDCAKRGDAARGPPSGSLLDIAFFSWRHCLASPGDDLVANREHTQLNARLKNQGGLANTCERRGGWG